jgi:hypothetical protein
MDLKAKEILLHKIVWSFCKCKIQFEQKQNTSISFFPAETSDQKNSIQIHYSARPKLKQGGTQLNYEKAYFPEFCYCFDSAKLVMLWTSFI